MLLYLNLVINMERDLTNILTEVLVFPYEQSIVDALEDSCSQYVESIEIGQYEDCVLHLCLDIPAQNLIQHINTQMGRKFPNRVYRALAGYVVGDALDTVSDEDDKVMFPLALRNALKGRTDDADGIISRTIDPTSFAVVEEYWKENIAIPSLNGKDIVSSEIFDKSTWSETGFEVDNCYGDIQALAKFYNREQFKRKFTDHKASDNQDIYAFAYQAANEIAAQDWLFTAEDPVQTLKNMDLKGSAISLANIKSKICANPDVVNEDIEIVSVFRRYLYANDYVELATRRISPLHFGIAIFYELLYERLKSERYE